MVRQTTLLAKSGNGTFLPPLSVENLRNRRGPAGVFFEIEDINQALGKSCVLQIPGTLQLPLLPPIRFTTKGRRVRRRVGDPYEKKSIRADYWVFLYSCKT
jgi:hypothetical protein